MYFCKTNQIVYGCKTNCINAPSAAGKNVSSMEQQEGALEGLLDMARQHGFLHAVFLSCDCHLERSNLFEDICSLVSKTAFPVSHKGLGAMHHISLEVLLAVLGALSAK